MDKTTAIGRLGMLIYNYRSTHSMSLRAFAELIGISPQYVSNIEKGLNNDGKPLSVSMDIYEKTARFFDISVSELSDVLYYDETGELLEDLISGKYKKRPTEESSAGLSEQEKQLIRYFRMLPADRRKNVLSLLSDLSAVEK